jgi:hypothetical protein
LLRVRLCTQMGNPSASRRSATAVPKSPVPINPMGWRTDPFEGGELDCIANKALAEMTTQNDPTSRRLKFTSRSNRP